MTTYAPPRYDENAKTYIQSLQAGQKPADRSDFGRWTETVNYAEKVFDLSNGRGQAVRNALASMCQLPKYAELKELLTNSANENAHSQTITVSSSNETSIMSPLPESAQLSPAVAALAKDGCSWLDRASEYVASVSPEGFPDFFDAGAIFVLSAVAAGRIVIPGGPTGEHTGFNMAYVSDPAQWAKTTTAQACINIPRAAGLGWLLGADETTPQRLLSDMSGRYPPSDYLRLSEEQQSWWKKRLAMAGQRAWYHDELGAFFRAMNKPNGPMEPFRGLLLKLDNRIPSYSYATQSRGHEQIDNPYLALLGSTTFADFRSVAKAGSSEWTDGMLSRFTLIVPPRDLFLDKPFRFETVPVPVDLSMDLRLMHEWLGYPIIDIGEEVDEKTKASKLVINLLQERPAPKEIKPSAQVEAAYHAYRSALRKMEKPEDLASSYVRLAIKALRMAALFAGIERIQTILPRHWAKAQELAERWRRSLHELYSQINASHIPAINTQEDKVLGYLEHHPGAKAREIYRTLNIDSRTARDILLNLLQSGDIIETSEQAGNGRAVKLYSRARGIK